MQEACGADTPFAAVTGADGLQYVAIFGVGVAHRASKTVA